METRRLQYFVEIVKAGSITRAASQLGMAQAALSQQLAILENEFKSKLVNRTPTGVQTTPAGATLFREAQVILRQIEQARSFMQAQSGQVSGVVSVGLTASTAALLSIPLLETAQQLFPQVHLQIIEGMSGDLTERLMNGQIDMATLLRNETRAGVASIPMFEEELFLISHRSAALASSVRLADLGNLPLLLPNNRQTLRALFDAVFRQADVEPTVVAEIDSISVMKAAVGRAMGATIHPLSIWRDGLESGQIRASRIVDMPVNLTFWLSRTGAPATAASEAVYGITRKIINDLLREGRIEGVQAL
jgi:DNA-binding transcriptional LysR family regulator